MLPKHSVRSAGASLRPVLSRLLIRETFFDQKASYLALLRRGQARLSDVFRGCCGDNPMANGSESKPDLEHLEWAIDQRANIQHTLLALYKFVRENSPDQLDLERRLLLHKGQEDFLASVITNNAINYSDDKRNRAWTVSYYLENAKHRIRSAHHNANHHMPHETLSEVLPRLNLKGTYKVSHTRFEWESVHMALRIILNILNPHLTLPIDSPVLEISSTGRVRSALPDE
jgi:hypothetical protein